MHALLDADAFIFLHSTSLLTAVGAIPAASLPLSATGYVAGHELSRLQEKVEGLIRQGRLRVHEVVARTPQYARFRDLNRNGADKGEAEAIAWAEAAGDPDIVFVSLDENARRLAKASGISACDVFDFVVRLVLEGLMTENVARDKLVEWEDKKKGFGRPKGYATFDEAFPAARLRLEGKLKS